MARVLIEVKGGSIISVASDNQDQEIVIVDWDNLQGEGPAFNGDVLSPDNLIARDEFHTLFMSESGVTSEELEVINNLKQIGW